MEPAGTAAPEPGAAMAVRGLAKSFGATQALEDFGLELRRGEIHALVGGNGSGKSTFIKILAGVHRADAGTLTFRGVICDLDQYGPERARSEGLRFVHQDLGVFPTLSVADNLAIGRGYPTAAAARIRWRACHEAAREILTRFHVDADPRALVSSLSSPQRAMLAIARALQSLEDDRTGILVLDEPTASLPADEANLLLSSIRRLADAGHSVLLVTHRLDEVRRVADRVTGLRDGGLVGTIDAADVSETDIVQLILGRRLEKAPSLRSAHRSSEPIVEVRGLRGGPVRDVSLAVHGGEVVGVAGLLGSGRTELLEMLFGARRREDGEILVDGRPVLHPAPRLMRRLGVAFVPEDRQQGAVFADQDVEENMTAGRLRPYFRGGRIRRRALRRAVDADMARFQVRAGSASARIETLSGGNQQKVVLARWLRDAPRVILLDEPTQGIDVGAREEIFGLIERAVADGAAAVLVSSEFEELTRLSHRIVVLSDGVIADELESGLEGHDVLQRVLEHARSLQA